MATILNKKEQVLQQLRQDNKSFVMESAEDMSKFGAIKDHMEDVSREYQIKDKQSQLSAATVLLTS